MSGRIVTEKEFIDRCKKVNPQFDYSEIGFTKIHKGFVYPICKKHGKFKFNARGICSKPITCPECDRENRFYTFVEKARKIHGDKYEYDINTYSTTKVPMTIICPIHGEFKQAPGDHLKGWGCSKCSKKYKPTTEEWIERVAPLYNYKFDYSKVKYVDNKTNVIIICPEHGEFLVTPSNHVKGNGGCPKCSAILRHTLQAKTTEQFIEECKKVHGAKYDYSQTVYYNNKEKVTIICPTHGEFKQTASSHLSGAGCPVCSTLKNQKLLIEKLNSSFPNLQFSWEASPKWLEKQRFDIYCEKYNFAIEYDGEVHYEIIDHFGGEKQLELIKYRDNIKNKKCLNNTCVLFRVKYGYTDEDYTKLVEYINLLIKGNKLIPKLEEGSQITVIAPSKQTKDKNSDDKNN